MVKTDIKRYMVYPGAHDRGDPILSVRSVRWSVNAQIEAAHRHDKD